MTGSPHRNSEWGLSVVGRGLEMTQKIVKICDWCRESIDTDAPAVQTTSVDVASGNGNDSQALVSKVRSYHLGGKDCYRRFLYQQRQGENTVRTAGREPLSADAVSQDAYDWGEAFDMTAEETLSGSRRKFSNARRRTFCVFDDWRRAGAD